MKQQHRFAISCHLIEQVHAVYINTTNLAAACIPQQLGKFFVHQLGLLHVYEMAAIGEFYIVEI